MPTALRHVGLLALTVVLLALAAPAARADKPLALAAACPTELPLGQTFECALSSVGQRTSFGLQAAPGEHIVVRMGLLSGGLYPQVLVRDGSAAPISLCSASGSTYAGFTCSLSGSGPFTLEAGDARNRDLGSYQLYVQRLGSPANDRPLAYGQTVAASLAGPIAADVYSFSAATAEQVQLRLRRVAGGLLPAVMVVNQAGATICEGEAQPQADLLTLLCDIQAPGVHRVLVEDFYHGAGGAYQLRLEALGARAADEVILPGAMRDGSVAEALGAKRYSFTARAGDQILLRALRRSGELALRLALYDAGGAQVCASEGTPLARLEPCPIPRDGQYTLVIDDRAGAATGEFRLFTQRLNNPDQYRLLGVGQPAYVRLAMQAGFDTYVYEAAAGDTIKVTVTGQSGALAPRVRVYNAQGKPVCSAEGARAATTTGCVLRGQGMHAIVIDDRGASATGDYALVIGCLSGSCVAQLASPPPLFLPLVRR